MAWASEFCSAGKLKVIPRGKGLSPGNPNVLHPSCTTSAMHLPIHRNRLSALSSLRWFAMGHDFSKRLCRRPAEGFDSEPLVLWPLIPVPLALAPFVLDPLVLDPLAAFSSASSVRSSTNPTLKLVPPL